MKEALLRKRYGIPAALSLSLLLVLFSLGAVIAWYCFATISSETEVQESLSANETKEFSATMFPGEMNTWIFDIANSASVPYTIKADLTFTEPGGVSISSFVVERVGVVPVDKTSDLTDDGSAEFSVFANETLTCELTISAAKDAALGEVSVSLALSRE